MEDLTKKIIIIGAGAVISLAALSPVLYEATIGHAEWEMQKRQDGIIRNLNYNPLTRTSDLKEFERLYRAEEEAYDNGHGVMHPSILEE